MDVDACLGLTDEEVRVLGCLAEKEATVPDTYPLTLNALRSACNQSSNRDPVVAYDDLTIQRALDSLKTSGFVRFVHPSHGERSTKFRHVAEERLGLDRAQLAVLSVLALRGPQTTAELRSRTDRHHRFDAAGEVDAVLEALAGRDEPLVVAIPRQPGQQHARWMHLLGGPVDVTRLAAAERPVVAGPAAGAATTGSAAAAADERLVALEAQVADLTERLGRLERELGL